MLICENSPIEAAPKFQGTILAISATWCNCFFCFARLVSLSADLPTAALGCSVCFRVVGGLDGIDVR